MSDFFQFLPEIYIAFTLLGILVGEAGYHGEKYRLSFLTALIGLSGAFLQLILQKAFGMRPYAGHVLNFDGISFYFRMFYMVLGGLSVVLYRYSPQFQSSVESEYYVFTLGAVLGGMVLSSSFHFTIVWLALAVLIICFSFIASIDRGNSLAVYGNYKFFVRGIWALLAVGLAMLLVYQEYSTLELGSIYRLQESGEVSGLIRLYIFGLLFLGFSLLTGVFPVSGQVPDLFQSLPLFAVPMVVYGTRVAGVLLLLRVGIPLFGNLGNSSSEGLFYKITFWEPWFETIAIVTVLYGGLLAFRQKSFMRAIGYLSIADFGFLIFCVATGGMEGLRQLSFSLFLQAITLCGVCYIYDEMRVSTGSDQISELRVKLRGRIAQRLVLIVMLACWLGLPPLPSFFIRFKVFYLTLTGHHYLLVGVGLLSVSLLWSVFGRILIALSAGGPRVLTLGSEEKEPLLDRTGWAFAVPSIAIALLTQPILLWMQRTFHFILW